MGEKDEEDYKELKREIESFLQLKGFHNIKFNLNEGSESNFLTSYGNEDNSQHPALIRNISIWTITGNRS